MRVRIFTYDRVSRFVSIPVNIVGSGSNKFDMDTDETRYLVVRENHNLRFNTAPREWVSLVSIPYTLKHNALTLHYLLQIINQLTGMKKSSAHG